MSLDRYREKIETDRQTDRLFSQLVATNLLIFANILDPDQA